MSQHYGALLTALGEAKITAAIAHHAQIQLTHLAVGDGDGQLPPLHSEQTTLVHEQYRVALNSLTIDPDNSSHLIAEAILREEVGGWWIREIGLFDEQGELCAVANCPETYKPKLEEGAGRTQVIRLVLIVSSATAVALTIDPGVALATREYVDEHINPQIEALSNQIQALKDELKKAVVSATLRSFEGDMEQNFDPGDYFVSNNQLRLYNFNTSILFEGGILKVVKISETVSYQLLIVYHWLFFRYKDLNSDNPEDSVVGYNHSWKPLMTENNTSAGEIIFKISENNDFNSGWLPCHGKLYHRKSFAKLFEMVGTQYGQNEDDEEYFRVPIISKITFKDQSGLEFTLYPYICTGKISDGLLWGSNKHHTHCFDNACIHE